MLHGTRREVALCFVLLVCVVSVTVYLTVFSLHDSSTATKLQIKSQLSQVYREENIVREKKKVEILPKLENIRVDAQATSNRTIRYGPDNSLPFNAGEVFNDEELQYSKRGMVNHAFNLLISDRIGPGTRPISDTRHGICRTKTYSNISTTASVIICFHKEAFSTLLRTVASVVERTPPQLLQEVVLVDDFSDNEDENVRLMSYLEHHYPYGKVRVVHSTERLGLIGARIMGAKEASGDVLVFLDSHCETNVGWLEPLLDITQRDRTTIVCPVVDIINSYTMAYVASPVLRGGFNWGLHFSWEPLPQEQKDPSAPFPSPTMAGGLFAVNRLYFQEIGYYDDEMKEWGGENLELSFRVWMCGGRLLIAPCSRVGHIFRKRRPNAIAGVDNPTRNSLRVAAVWMDDYASIFHKQIKMVKAMDYGDVTSRIQLRKDLQCKDFEWYLNHVYPELGIPGGRMSKVGFYRPLNMEEKFKEVQRGLIKVTGLDLCLQSDDTKGALVVASKCNKGLNSQMWRFTEMGQLKFGIDSRLCMDTSASQNPRLMKCTAEEGPQTWKFFPMGNVAKPDQITGRLFSISEGLCLQLSGGDLSESYELIMQICSSPSVQAFAMESS